MMLNVHHIMLSILSVTVKCDVNLNHSNSGMESTISTSENNQHRDSRLGIKEDWLPMAFCKSGLPLLKTKICNGKVDCFDGSDETAERCRNRKCKNDNFRCDYGGCVSKTQICNGAFNCADGSDEKRDVCRMVNCVIPYPANNTVYFVPGCDECRSGSRIKEGSILSYQCTSGNAEVVSDSTDVICRNGLWIPSIPVCVENKDTVSTVAIFGQTTTAAVGAEVADSGTTAAPASEETTAETNNGIN